MEQKLLQDLQAELIAKEKEYDELQKCFCECSKKISLLKREIDFVRKIKDEKIWRTLINLSVKAKKDNEYIRIDSMNETYFIARMSKCEVKNGHIVIEYTSIISIYHPNGSKAEISCEKDGRLVVKEENSKVHSNIWSVKSIRNLIYTIVGNYLH